MPVSFPPRSTSYSSSSHSASCSLPSPDKAWAGGNPTILSDEDVERWLSSNHPEAAREIQRENRAIREQHDSEVSLGSGTKAAGSFEDLNIGTPVSDNVLPEKHWAYILYPGCGAEEICEVLLPVLSPARHEVLRLALAEGLEHKEIAVRYGCTRAAITLRLSAIRKTLFALFQSQALPRPTEDRPTEDAEIRELFAEEELRSGGAPARHLIRSPGEARVCDCGRHLNRRHLDHRKITEERERTLRCDFCNRSYGESQWALLAA